MAAKRVYKYFNPNPSKKEVEDCVERALCVVTGRDWLSVYDELCVIGREIFCSPNWKDCYEEFLRRNGFEYVPISNKKGSKRPTVEGFTREHKIGSYFLRVSNHVVGCKDGVYYDLWNSGDCCLYSYWKVKGNI